MEKILNSSRTAKYGKIAASATLKMHFDLFAISTGQSILISTFLWSKIVTSRKKHVQT